MRRKIKMYCLCVLAGCMILTFVGYYYRKNIKENIKQCLVDATMEQCLFLKYSDYNKQKDTDKVKEKADETTNVDNFEENTESMVQYLDSNDKENETSLENNTEQKTTSNTEETTQKSADNISSHIEKVCSVDVSTLSYEYLLKNYYTVASTTKVYENELNASKLMGYDLSMKQDNSAPQILVYHTHGQEAFADSGDAAGQKTIVQVGEYLCKILREKYGYNVIHITDSFDLINGVLDRSKAYDYAYNTVSKVLEENPTVEVVIDLHRDGIDESQHLVTNINGKQTAKIMFFNGMSRMASTGDIGYLYNPNREMNLAMSLQMKVKAMEYYPEFTRRNYLQAYEYNLQLRPKAMLIEAGAQTNTFQEELNAMEPLADIFNKILN